MTAITFFSDKRSILFAGSSNGQLVALNAHGSHEDYVVASAYCGNAPVTGIISSFDSARSLPVPIVPSAASSAASRAFMP